MCVTVTHLSVKDGFTSSSWSNSRDTQSGERAPEQQTTNESKQTSASPSVQPVRVLMDGLSSERMDVLGTGASDHKEPEISPPERRAYTHYKPPTADHQPRRAWLL